MILAIYASVMTSIAAVLVVGYVRMFRNLYHFSRVLDNGSGFVTLPNRKGGEDTYFVSRVTHDDVGVPRKPTSKPTP